MKRNINISIICFMLAIAALFSSGCITITIPPVNSTPHPTEIPADPTDVPTEAPTAEPTEAPTEIPPEPTEDVIPINHLMIIPASDKITVSRVYTDEHYDDGTYLYWAEEIMDYYEGNTDYPLCSASTNTAFAAEPNEGESMTDFIKRAIILNDKDSYDITVEENGSYDTGEAVYPGFAAEWFTGFNEDTELAQGIIIYAEGYVLMYYYETYGVNYNDDVSEKIAQILSEAYLGCIDDAEG